MLFQFTIKRPKENLNSSCLEFPQKFFGDLLNNVPKQLKCRAFHLGVQASQTNSNKSVRLLASCLWWDIRVVRVRDAEGRLLTTLPSKNKDRQPAPLCSYLSITHSGSHMNPRVAAWDPSKDRFQPKHGFSYIPWYLPGRIINTLPW